MAQGPQAAARLQQIGNALKIAGKSGGTATAIEDVVPAVAGALTGGADLGILGSMIGGKVTRAPLSPWTTRYAGAFDAAIDLAARHPAAAWQRVADLPKGNYSPLEALRMFGRTILTGVDDSATHRSSCRATCLARGGAPMSALSLTDGFGGTA